MNINEIRELAEIMSQHSLSEINIEENGTKISLSKAFQNTAQVPVTIPQFAINESEAVAEIPVKEDGKFITSPTVGVFYSSSSPESEAYVTVGSKIKAGDVLCIIEAMKLMNEIQADTDGEIVEVLVGNGQVVEYDQPLFRVR